MIILSEAQISILCEDSYLYPLKQKTPFYLHSKGFKMYPEPESNRQGKNPTGF
jgi:hypothetical protein